MHIADCTNIVQETREKVEEKLSGIYLHNMRRLQSKLTCSEVDYFWETTKNLYLEKLLSSRELGCTWCIQKSEQHQKQPKNVAFQVYGQFNLAFSEF